MQVTIYGSRLSPFVEKVIRGVQRKGLTWQLIEPKSPTDLEKWNPQTRETADHRIWPTPPG